MSYYFMLDGEIEPDSAREMLHNLWIAHNDDERAPWTVYVNSDGGNLEDGSAIYNTLQQFSIHGGGQHQITTHILGKAYSAGSIVAQAGDVRVAGPLSLWMFHEPESCIHASLNQIRADVDIMDRWMINVTEIMVERSNLTAQDVHNYSRNQNWYLDAQGLLNHGLIDYITGQDAFPIK